MSDKPIIFSGSMVRAVLEGRKWQTRRLARLGSSYASPARQIKVGDRLWVREAVQKFNRQPPTMQYVATITGVVAPPGVVRHPNGAALWPSHWKRDKVPSIHMPRWASRLTLTVTATRIERLHNISDQDAHAEGVSAADEFRLLWESLHGAKSWQDNPLVVAISFLTFRANIDAPTESRATEKARGAFSAPPPLGSVPP